MRVWGLGFEGSWALGLPGFLRVLGGFEGSGFGVLGFALLGLQGVRFVGLLGFSDPRAFGRGLGFQPGSSRSAQGMVGAGTC